ncbi:MAG: tRNA (N6-isopentenyl adenosine(37)-C2)-methylthiotransferase MiaB [Candidatus Omnitrophota bacterium]
MTTKRQAVYIKTFGCQMNDRDTEILKSMLADKGYSFVLNPEEADIILYNTCSVRGHAEDRVWGQLKQFTSPNIRKKIIGLVGCMAKIYGKKIFDKLPNVNLVCGPANIYDIPKLLEKLQNGTTRIVATDKKTRPVRNAISNGARPEDKTNHQTRDAKICAYVSIMEGCDNFCSYCVVPYARGHERSRPAKEILNEIKCLIDNGYKDITLLGQNVSSYKDINRLAVSGSRLAAEPQAPSDFVRLLEEIDKIAGNCRIRFVTSHPKDASEDLFEAMRDFGSVCEYLHLPLQSGSDRILEAMNRKYTGVHYLKLVEKLRKYVPECAITTDIIVGFPGETQEDFNATRKLMTDIEFDSAFIFKYSPRPHTAAEKLNDDVSKDAKKERNQILLALQEEISRKKNEGLVGKTVEVMAEGKNRKGVKRDDRGLKRDEEGTGLMGRTRTNKIVIFPGQPALTGKFVNVKITQVTPHTLIGEVASL